MYMDSYYLDIIAAQGEQIGFLKERLAILERRTGLSSGRPTMMQVVKPTMMQVVKLDFNQMRR